MTVMRKSHQIFLKQSKKLVLATLLALPVAALAEGEVLDFENEVKAVNEELMATQIELTKNKSLFEETKLELQKNDPMYQPRTPFESDAEYLARQVEAKNRLIVLHDEMFNQLERRDLSLRNHTFETNDLCVSMSAQDYKPNERLWPMSVELCDANGGVMPAQEFTLSIETNAAKTLHEKWAEIKPKALVVQKPDGDYHIVKLILDVPSPAPVDFSPGSTIAEVEKVNGKPFLMYGFEIDRYVAGMVSSWEGGAVEGQLQFEYTTSFIEGITGDGPFRSDDPLLTKAGVVVARGGASTTSTPVRYTQVFPLWNTFWDTSQYNKALGQMFTNSKPSYTSNGPPTQASFSSDSRVLYVRLFNVLYAMDLYTGQTSELGTDVVYGPVIGESDDGGSIISYITASDIQTTERPPGYGSPLGSPDSWGYTLNLYASNHSEGDDTLVTQFVYPKQNKMSEGASYQNSGGPAGKWELTSLKFNSKATALNVEGHSSQDYSPNAPEFKWIGNLDTKEELSEEAVQSAVWNTGVVKATQDGRIGLSHISEYNKEVYCDIANIYDEMLAKKNVRSPSLANAMVCSKEGFREYDCDLKLGFFEDESGNQRCVRSRSILRRVPQYNGKGSETGFSVLSPDGRFVATLGQNTEEKWLGVKIFRTMSEPIALGDWSKQSRKEAIEHFCNALPKKTAEVSVQEALTATIPLAAATAAEQNISGWATFEMESRLNDHSVEWLREQLELTGATCR